VRLGLTQSTYQYLFSPPQGLFADRATGFFDERGMPAPYFLSTPVTIEPASATEWLITRCAQLGLPVCHANLMSREPAYVDKIKRLLQTHDIELMPALAIDAIAGGDATKAGIDFAIEQLRFYRDFGGVAIAKYCTYPMVHNRFRSDPPLREQLERIVENSRPIVKAAEEAGITLAFENHLDYRASEVVQIIEAIDSPNLRFLFDMGNTVVVIEDPVEAAKVAAPYTVLCHLKDVRILPWTPGALYVAAVFAAPLGRGNVEIETICEILQQHAPDPRTLCLSLENMPVPPNEDEDRWVVEGITWAKERLARFLND
jgi:sugar phosphate isomerase/epimerase